MATRAVLILGTFVVRAVADGDQLSLLQRRVAVLADDGDPVGAAHEVEHQPLVPVRELSLVADTDGHESDRNLAHDRGSLFNRFWSELPWWERLAQDGFRGQSSADEQTIPGSHSFRGQILKLLIPNLICSLCYLVLVELAQLCFMRASYDISLAAAIFVIFQDNVLFSVLFLDSWRLASDLSASAAFSAAILSFHKVGTSVGDVLFSVAQRHYPGLWNSGPLYFALCTWLQLFGAVVFGACSLSAVAGSDSPVLFARLLLGRFLSGIGGGLLISQLRHQSARVASGELLRLQNKRLFIAGCLGLGIGPILSCFTKFMFVCTTSAAKNFEHESVLPLVAALAVVQFVWLPFLPVISSDDGDKAEVLAGNSSQQGSLIAVAVCMAMYVWIASTGLNAFRP